MPQEFGPMKWQSGLLEQIPILMVGSKSMAAYD